MVLHQQGHPGRRQGDQDQRYHSAPPEDDLGRDHQALARQHLPRRDCVRTDVDCYELVITDAREPSRHTPSSRGLSPRQHRRGGLDLRRQREEPNPYDFFIWDQLAAGTYYISVSGHGGAQGAYALKVRTFPDTSKRKNAANPPLGGTASGNI